jgi:hypothetical protein
MTRADKRKFHYIYKITRQDGKYYIGLHSTDNLDDGYFGSGQLLWKSIKKHGKDKHAKEILEFLPSRAELRIREQELIGDRWKEDTSCMNLRPGGEGGMITESGIARLKNRVISDETRAKMSASGKAKPQISQDTRAKMSQSQTGRKHKEETKAKISKSNTGKPKAPEAIIKSATARLANMSESTREKLGSGNRGKPMSEEQKMKIAEGVEASLTNEVRTKMSASGKAAWTDERKARHAEKMKAHHALRRLKLDD